MTADNPAPTTPKRRRPVFAYIVGIGTLLMGLFGAVRGMQWSLSLALAAIGIMVLIGLGKRLYRAAVYRTGAQEIICRFIPWYQAAHLAGCVLFPIIGIAFIAQGFQPGSPFWLRYGGYLIFVLGIVFALSALLAWIANRLVITPSSLSLKIVFRPEQHISRGNVRAITPRMGRNSATGAPRLHVEFTYTPADGKGESTVTVGMLEGQFTVDPANLGAGLQAWKDGDPADPALMDRVEAILRGTASGTANGTANSAP